MWGALLALLLLAVPRAGRAAEAPGARITAGDTLRAVTPAPEAESRRAASDSALADSARVPRTERARGIPTAPAVRPRFFDQPRWVMLRSVVVPGWGQAHNRAWLKALAVAATESWVGVALIADENALHDLDGQIAVAKAARDIEGENALIARYNDRLSGSVRHQWLLAGILAYAMLDAYVDAHFRDFKLEFEHDPALPGGVSRAGVRVSVRWDL